jgi:asparagine synthase (glutamine-hydrolysing)
MCGIAGYVGTFPDHVLNDMSGALAQRGPDGEGLWRDGQEGVGLAHRRLSIIDLSAAANQPMEGVGGRYVIVFNGEIYNFKELAADLLSRGYSFNQNSDTAVLAPLYDCYGTRMLEKLSGIFAFSLWDRTEKTLFCARDHLGIKPFYYAYSDRGLAFASEMKSLLHTPNIDRRIDEQALFSYISYLWSPGENTLLKGVRKLLPGHFMMFTKGEAPTLRRWYQPPQARIENGRPVYNTRKTAADLAHLLDEVVSDQMISDVPVGAFLSGGLDSSAVVASMAKKLKNPSSLQTYCIRFDGRDMEAEGFGADVLYARKVAGHLGVSLNELTMTASSLEKLPETVFFLDEPEADPAPIYVKAICAKAREMGIKVMMSGTGGDDIFSGYRRHQVMALKERIDLAPAFMRQAAASALRAVPGGNVLKRRLTRLSRLMEWEQDKALIWAFYYTEPAILTQVLSDDLRTVYANRRADHLESQLGACRGQAALNRQLYLELFGFLPDHNLNYTDKLSMAAGVEVRVPLLDPRLLDFAADLPPHEKLGNGITKRIFKRAMESRLPHDVIYRPKAGFGAPVRHWINGPSADFMRELVLSPRTLDRGLFSKVGVEKLIDQTRRGEVDGAYTLLSLMVIELWFRQFMDQKTPRQMAA